MAYRIHTGYKFYDMGNKGLKYPVYCGKTCVIKAKTKHVKIGFRQSNLTYRDEYGRVQNMNVYQTKDGKIYHGV